MHVLLIRGLLSIYVMQGSHMDNSFACCTCAGAISNFAFLFVTALSQP